MSDSKHNHEKTRLLMRKRKCVHLLSNSPFMSRNTHNGGSGKNSPERWQKFNFNVKPQGSGAGYPWGIWLYFLSPGWGIIKDLMWRKILRVGVFGKISQLPGNSPQPTILKTLPRVPWDCCFAPAYHFGSCFVCSCFQCPFIVEY